MARGWVSYHGHGSLFQSQQRLDVVQPACQSDASEQLVSLGATRKVADGDKHSLPVSPAEAAQAPACCP